MNPKRSRRRGRGQRNAGARSHFALATGTIKDEAPEQMSDQSEIRNLDRLDAHNLEQTYKLLGHAAQLPDNLVKLYQLLSDALTPVLAPHLAPPQARHAAALYT